MTKEREAENTANNENTNSNDMPLDAESAKQERQQESDTKKNLRMEYDGKYFQVMNEGDEKPMYESEVGDATMEFAQKVAEEHNVDLVISDRVKEALKRQQEEESASHDREGERHESRSESERHESRNEGRRYEERDTEGPRNVIVEDDGRYYIVRNEGDRAKLYESRDKDATLDFARKMAQEHEVDLIVLDRDRRVQLEEQYNKKDDQSEEGSERKAS
jgi:hypothetical protein